MRCPSARAVCALQDDIVADLPHTGQYELNQLSSQLEEIETQLSEIEAALKTPVRP